MEVNFEEHATDMLTRCRIQRLFEVSLSTKIGGVCTSDFIRKMLVYIQKDW